MGIFENQLDDLIKRLLLIFKQTIMGIMAMFREKNSVFNINDFNGNQTCPHTTESPDPVSRREGFHSQPRAQGQGRKSEQADLTFNHISPPASTLRVALPQTKTERYTDTPRL